ncbi:hypothetical protein [Planomicrobium sp. CPCC 101110]|uniref:hypothetical protein n=1 Tax=Planomicrobium sp. CPCC 101110 TaxID=2599619 RepID=UPI0011B7A72D|nr:hypothetical protein [Planomicrobium sp. CPCC 101110]TWT25805.1 hypothetical protein FQV30_08370 [Planomicrobium sp. CPCC 101110]
MRTGFKTCKDNVIQVMGLHGLAASHRIQKTIMETGLYSVYILSDDGSEAKGEVLLIEHPPAQQHSAHLLSLKSKKPLTTSELMEEIVDALEKHFAHKA